MLQCVAVCCSVLQCVARKTRCKQTVLFGYCSVVQWIAGCWCSLQCVAVCLAHYYCSWIVLFLESGFCRFNANKHCVAVCCSVLQYTAMCCSFKCVLRPSVFWKMCPKAFCFFQTNTMSRFASADTAGWWVTTQKLQGAEYVAALYTNNLFICHNAPHCITPHHTLTHCLSSCKCFKARQSTYCNTLQRTATRRKTTTHSTHLQLFKQCVKI